MGEAFVATNAASSGVTLERKIIKALCKHSDRYPPKPLVKFDLLAEPGEECRHD